MAEGGTLRLGSRHVYLNDGLSSIYGMLKGIDAVVYRSARTLKFKPLLYLYYEVKDCSLEDALDILMTCVQILALSYTTVTRHNLLDGT